MQSFDNIQFIDPGDYIVFRINGLFGDILHSLSRIQYVLNKYPKSSVIIIHEYSCLEKIKIATSLFDFLKSIRTIKYYLYILNPNSHPITQTILDKLRQFGITGDRIFDCYVFQKKPPLITPPLIGIDIPHKIINNKAVIFRYSGLHHHYPMRNRPYNEWILIQQILVKNGYDIYLVGHDDLMPCPSFITDLRRKLNIVEILKFTSNASVCISVTTFLYVWTQFVCPTLILTEAGDIPALNTFWKLTDNLELCNIENMQYLDQIESFVKYTRWNVYGKL